MANKTKLMQTRKMTDSNTEQTKVVIVLHFTAILFFHSFFFILTSDDSDDPVDHPEPCYYPSNHSNMARWLRIDSHPSSFSFFCLRVFHSIPAFSPEIILFRKDILNLNHGNPRKGLSIKHQQDMNDTGKRESERGCVTGFFFAPDSGEQSEPCQR
ncbi:MAG: hypothetical protein JOS17DRAFT_59410 [Linnemannia elongata]|nr:MAG: hypothetical protein JOS17DRAFT_59410 [Linnemannia elongata]